MSSQVTFVKTLVINLSIYAVTLILISYSMIGQGGAWSPLGIRSPLRFLECMIAC